MVIFGQRCCLPSCCVQCEKGRNMSKSHLPDLGISRPSQKVGFIAGIVRTVGYEVLAGG